MELTEVLDVTLETPKPGQIKLYAPKTYKGKDVVSTGYSS